MAPTLRPIAARLFTPPESVIDFGERVFYVPETSQPIHFEPVQKIILELMFNPAYARYFGCLTGYQTLLFSTVKKSGKTTIGALVARWIAETWGRFNEVYCMANDKEQARGRVYAKALSSIELDPRYSRQHKSIPGYWDIIERQATHIPTGSYLRAVSNDYKGEAGANPTASVWSELWGYSLEALRRLWDEMTPVPTRPRSIRFVETYAGFEGESLLLIDLYERATFPAKGARRLTARDLLEASDGALVWPYPDEYELPLYVNENARTFAYWDTGTRARRMPWHTPEYYQAQSAELRPEAFDRFHNNNWVAPIAAFLPKEWWLACRPSPDDALPPLERGEPVVVAADASVSGDSTGLVAVSRNRSKVPNPAGPKATVVRRAQEFRPPQHGKLNYNTPDGFKDTLRRWRQEMNVVEVAYDEYQLHDVMTTFRETDETWTRPFSQGADRMVADFGLYQDIRDRKILDDSDSPELTAHLGNAAAQFNPKDITKMRIVKRAEDKKIDLAVCLSMARHECIRLNLD